MSMRKKAMSVENLDDYDVVDDASNDTDSDYNFSWRRADIQLNYQPVSKPASLHSPALTARPLNLNIGKAMSVENLIDSPALPSRPPPASAPTLARRISFSGLTNNQIEQENRKSITNLLESRKKSMSKLRGLVIPEKVSEADQKVLDLPVIRSKECELISGNKIFNRSVSLQCELNSSSQHCVSLIDVFGFLISFLSLSFSLFLHHTASPVLSQQPPTIVKSISERKSEYEIAAYSRKTASSNGDEKKKRSVVEIVKSPPIKPPRTSLIISRTSATDESDSESCMSSRASPPASPVAKKPLSRTHSSETNTSMSSNSTLTSGSGSQASCSSNASSPDGRIINNNSKQSNGNGGDIGTSRKSILASSKSRSGRECLDKSWRDEDSTDGGGIDHDDRRRVSKAKSSRTSSINSAMINYKLVSAGDNLVDKVINVATYVEVVSSDSDEKPEANKMSLPVAKTDTSSTTAAAATVTMTTTATASFAKKEAPQGNHMLSDMAKWVRSEATKVSEPAIVVKQETASTEIKTTACKVLEPPRKLSLAEIRKNFENKAVVNNEKQQTTAQTIHASNNLTNGTTPTKSIKEKPISNHDRFSSWDSVGSSSSGVSSEMLGTGTGTHNSESLQTDFGSFSSFGSSHSLITPQVSRRER